MATGMGNSAQALSTGQSAFLRSSVRRASADDENVIIFPDMTLGGLVESEVIPRLLMAHPRDIPAPRMDVGAVVSHEEATRFAPLALEMEADELLAEVEGFLARGVTVETVFVDLLAASARRLGELWEDDSADFVAVTMGLWRLQEVMREIALRSPPIVASATAMPRALFAPVPGDQHSFGSLMVEEVFARAGWQSEVLFEPQRRELLQIVGDKSFDLVGLTVSHDCPSAALADLITAIRSVSRNPALRIIIGGRVINACPGLAAEVGADGTAPDAQAALALAERLVTVTEVSVDWA